MLESDCKTHLVDNINESKAELSSHDSSNKDPSEKYRKSLDSDSPGMTGNSMLLNKLLSWHKAGQEKKLEPNVVIRDTYRLVSKIGEGGMGEVWKALDLIQDAGESHDRFVAIKFLNQEFQGKEFALKALVREFARYKKLIHPNLVRAYELNRDENLLFIVMEFLPGMSLDKFIRSHPDGVSIKQARPIIKGMCDALEYSHQEGVIHLDFKPSNVFYNPETGEVKVIDFGIENLAKKQDRELTRFDPGILGAKTEAYATLEMMLDADPQPNDDVYGLSCVIYEILTGKHPYKHLNVVSAESKALKPELIQGLNKSQFRALERGLAFQRKNRTKTAGKLFHELFPKLIETDWRPPRKGLVAALILLIVAAMPILSSKVDDWQLQRITDGIKVLNADSINKFQNLDSELQLRIVNDEAVGGSLVEYYISVATPEKTALDSIQKYTTDIQERLLHKRNNRRLLVTHSANLIDQAIHENKYDLAKKIADRFSTQYSDSKMLASQITLVENARNKQLAVLNDKFDQCLNDARHTLIDLSECLNESAKQLNIIDPNINVLNNPKLSSRFDKETQVALAINDLPKAEKLLAIWNDMLPSDSPRRLALIQRLEHQQEVEAFTSRILAANNIALEGLIRNLLDSEPSIRKEVLAEQRNHNKLKNWYLKTAQDLINADQYEAGADLFSQAKKVFSEEKTMPAWIKSLEQDVALNRKERLQFLSERYNTVLKQDKLDAQALIDMRQQVQAIDSGNTILSYPRVRETYSDKIATAINSGRFDLSKRYLQDWRMLRPEDADSDLFKALSTKHTDTLNTVQKRKAVIEALQAKLENEPFSQVLHTINSLNADFSDLEQKYILGSIKSSFLQSFSRQIATHIQRNEYAAAFQLANDALIHYPDEQVIIVEKNKIKEARTKQINGFLSQYQALLEADTLQGNELFNQLDSIYMIDQDYIFDHPELFKALGNRLKASISIDHSLTDLKNVFVQWERFLEQTKHIEEQDVLLKKKKNYIALQSLFKAKILKSEGSFEQATTYLSFGLSLSPSDRITASLNEELN